MMYAKASSDDTAKHKKCINNAKIMQNQSRKKCTENAKTSHQRMPWNAKQNKKSEKTRICPLNKCKKRHNKCNKNAPKRHNKCDKNAQTIQNKCNQKAKQMRSNTFWSLPLHFFALYLRFVCDLFAFFGAFP